MHFVIEPILTEILGHVVGPVNPFCPGYWNCGCIMDIPHGQG